MKVLKGNFEKASRIVLMKAHSVEPSLLVETAEGLGGRLVWLGDRCMCPERNKKSYEIFFRAICPYLFYLSSILPP